MRGLEGKKVIITGAAAGIGLATAQRFYEEGCVLCLVDLPQLADTPLGDMFPERMTYVGGDVRDEDTLARARDWGNENGLDVLINNAGITRDAASEAMTDQQWDDVISVNLTALFKWCQMAGNIMADADGGVILNAASVVAHYGNLGQANYTASKGGVIALTKTLAKELGTFDVRVNAVAPGFIETAMVADIPRKIRKQVNKRTPLGRLGAPEEVASCYAFLASDEASFITCTVINVDGGLVV